MSKKSIDYDTEITKCKTVEDLMGKNGLIKRMIKQAMEKILQAELDTHLGYKKHDPKGKNSGNSRNGSSEKHVRSSVGDLELDIPRDRNGSFEPQLLEKHSKSINEFDEKIISMYAKGMTTRDIQGHINEMYGVDISPTMVSMITDKVSVLVHEWQERALQDVYAVVYFDAIHYKIRENGKVVTKAAYTCFGIDLHGMKDILGMWISENEGSRHWLTIFNELKNRGVKDILIACVDGLKGLPEALESAFPRVNVQLCVVHMIRNSLKYVSSKNQKEFIKDLRAVYEASSEEYAHQHLDNFCEKWQKTYPLAVNPWVDKWTLVSVYYKFCPELRRMMYTTNAVEALHRQFRKVTKNRSIMPNDDSLKKLLFLAARDIRKKWAKPVRNWAVIITDLHLFFKDRITIASPSITL